MTRSNILIVLKISVFLIFLGRAWQHLVWDAPYRSFFWDESLLSPIIESVLHIPWQTYATSKGTDRFIQGLIYFNGILYGLSAITVFVISKKNIKWLQWIILSGGISLITLAILLTKEKFYHTAMFFEHSIQFSLPFALLLWLKDFKIEKFKILLKLIIAFTFFSHGLYAFGFYPVPGKFIDMVISILHTSEAQSINLLYIVGILDFIVAVLIFIPKISKYALWYCVIWGLLTALARILANFYMDFAWQSLNQNLYQVLYRIPHGLTPLLSVLIADHEPQLQDSRVKKAIA